MLAAETIGRSFSVVNGRAANANGRNGIPNGLNGLLYLGIVLILLPRRTT
jgi:hypothetical protein